MPTGRGLVSLQDIGLVRAASLGGERALVWSLLAPNKRDSRRRVRLRGGGGWGGGGEGAVPAIKKEKLCRRQDTAGQRGRRAGYPPTDPEAGNTSQQEQQLVQGGRSGGDFYITLLHQALDRERSRCDDEPRAVHTADPRTTSVPHPIETPI